MFGKRGVEATGSAQNKILSVDKAARILSLDDRIASLVDQYQELRINTIKDDAAMIESTAATLREAIKAKGIGLDLAPDEADSDIRAFIASFNHAREQNTGRRADWSLRISITRIAVLALILTAQAMSRTIRRFQNLA